MKVLVLDGSPKMQLGNTFKVTEAFLNGFKNKNSEINIIHLRKKNINDCSGCFSCWKETPGKCVFQDDMTNLLELYKTSHIIIWSFPLYYFGMPSKIKAFLDRLLPLNLPTMNLSEDKERVSHPYRYEILEQQFVLISTCGFPIVKNNYEALEQQFDLIYPNGYTKILCSEGGVLNIPQLKEPVNKYLALVTNAGIEFRKNKKLCKSTEVALNKLIISKEKYIALANLSWNNSENISKYVSQNEKNHYESLLFLKEMAIMYNPKNKQTKENIVFEFKFTDINVNYQLILKEDKCEIKTDNFLPFSTQIITTFSLWQDISKGNVSGQQALIDKKYNIKGSLDNLINLNSYFSEEGNEEKKLKSNMNLLLYPWIFIWITVGMIPKYTGLISIILSFAVPLIFNKKLKITVFDKLSNFLILILGSLLFLEVNPQFILLLSYFLFGLMWILSCLKKKSLTAYYSDNDNIFNNNPIFLKTNKILTFSWGILYLLTTIWSWYLLSFPNLFKYIGLINSIFPVLLMKFTNWFKVWYPKKSMEIK